MDKDEIVFSGAYKDFNLGVNFDVTGKQPRDVALTLSFISSRIEPFAFRFSGLNMQEMDAMASEAKGTGLASVYGFLEANPPKGLKSRLEKTLPDPLLLPAAESCLLNMLLTKAGVPFKAVPGDAPFKPQDEPPGEVIAFIGKYGQWVAIKKLGLEGVKDYEVAGILAGINHTIVNKAFDFARRLKTMPWWHPSARGNDAR